MLEDEESLKFRIKVVVTNMLLCPFALKHLSTTLVLHVQICTNIERSIFIRRSLRRDKLLKHIDRPILVQLLLSILFPNRLEV